MKNLSFFSVLFLAAWCISPPLVAGPVYRVIAVVSLFIVCVDSFKWATPRHRKGLYIAIFLSMYMIGIGLIHGENFAQRINLFVLLLYSSVFSIWMQNPTVSSKRLHFVILWILIFFSIWNTTTIRAVLEQPNIMRLLAKNEIYEDFNVSLWGVGGYGYMYAAIMILPVGFDMLMGSRIKLNLTSRAITLYFVLSTLVMSYLSQYFMALIIVVIIAILGLRKGGEATLSTRAYASIFFIFLIIGISIEPILDFLIDVIDLPIINNKLIDFRAVLNGAEVEDSDFGERYERYTRDLRLMFSNPIFGSQTYMSIGKHSTFLDVLAQYGFFIGALTIHLLLRPSLEWINRKLPVANNVFIAFLIFGLLNPVTMNSATSLYIALPVYCKLIWQKS